MPVPSLTAILREQTVAGRSAPTQEHNKFPYVLAARGLDLILKDAMRVFGGVECFEGYVCGSG
jgi:hypothetical protein